MNAALSRIALHLTAIPLIGLAVAGTALAATPAPPAGATSCSGCHPPNARVGSPVPQLVGQNASQIVAAMTAFRAGTRQATVMDRIAKGFSETETQAIADWYAAQK
jgi:sulfide dehydrogenase cytochrome subunit